MYENLVQTALYERADNKNKIAGLPSLAPNAYGSKETESKVEN